MLRREIETHNNASNFRRAQRPKGSSRKAKAIVISADSFDGQHRISVLEDYFKEERRRERATKRAGQKTKRI